MHYLTYVFIPKDGDITCAVTEAMRPYGDGFAVKPWKRYLDASEIAAMARHFKVRRTAVRKLAERMHEWNGGSGGVDRIGLYAVLSCNRDAKWDWYEIGGRWDGPGRRIVVRARTLLHSPKLKALLPHDFLTPDGQWHERARYVRTSWVAGRLVQKAKSRWLQEFKQALANYPRHRIVCVDRHA